MTAVESRQDAPADSHRGSSGLADVKAEAGDPVEAAVRAIDACAELPALEAADRVGKIALDCVYGGDVALWRQRGEFDPVLGALAMRISYRRLRSSVGLYRRIAIHVMLEESPILRDLPHLQPGQCLQVLALPQADRVQLLQRAVPKRWSALRLGAAVDRILEEQRASARPLSRFETEVKRIHGEIVAQGALLPRKEELKALDPQAVHQTFVEMMQVREAFEEVQRRMHPYMKRALAMIARREGRRRKWERMNRKDEGEGRARETARGTDDEDTGTGDEHERTGTANGHDV